MPKMFVSPIGRWIGQTVYYIIIVSQSDRVSPLQRSASYRHIPSPQPDNLDDSSLRIESLEISIHEKDSIIDRLSRELDKAGRQIDAMGAKLQGVSETHNTLAQDDDAALDAPEDLCQVVAAAAGLLGSEARRRPQLGTSLPWSLRRSFPFDTVGFLSMPWSLGRAFLFAY